MDSLTTDSLLVALRENSAALVAVNHSLWYGFGFVLGLIFIGAVYRLWLR